MTDHDPEVERIAELCWRASTGEGLMRWPDAAWKPDQWRSVARATIADRTAQRANPGATHWEGCWADGPEHYQCLRERANTIAHARDAALADRERWAKMVQSMRAVLADRADQPPVTDGPTLMEVARERDAARTRAVTAERERDDAQREIALLRDQVRQEQQNQDDYLKDHVAEVTRLRDRAANDALSPANDGRVFVIFDGPPSHESGRFVEVEDENGRGVNAGAWIHRLDGLWSLGPFYLTAQEPPANRVGGDRDAAIMSAVSVAPAPSVPRFPRPCGALLDPSDGTRCQLSENHDGPCYRQPAPTLSPAGILSGAETALHQLATTEWLHLDPEEAAAIVAELDRLRAENDALRARAIVAETRHAAESEHLISHGRSVERAAVVAWLHQCGAAPADVTSHSLHDAIDAARAKEKP